MLYMLYYLYVGVKYMNEIFIFKKSLGQNFLKDQNVIHNIVDSAKVDKDTLLIEVGPGAGAITKELVPLSGFSLLYEADNRLEGTLKDVLSNYNNYSIIIGDFLKANVKNDINNYNLKKLFVVANLPYYITTPIIMKFIDDDCLPDKFVIMMQKEVALRLTAQAGSRDYGSLTVFLNYYYDIYKLFDVSRNCFIPKPNVDSVVVEMRLKKERLNIKNLDLFKKLVKDSFRFKRKNLRNNLSNYNLNIIGNVLNEYGYDLSVRAENLNLEIFVDMANRL